MFTPPFKSWRHVAKAISNLKICCMLYALKVWGKRQLYYQIWSVWCTSLDLCRDIHHSVCPSVCYYRQHLSILIHKNYLSDFNQTWQFKVKLYVLVVHLTRVYFHGILTYVIYLCVCVYVCVWNQFYVCCRESISWLM